jgi:hypothetical protein
VRDHSEAIRAFFEAYAQHFNDALADPPRVDVETIRNAYADYFVGTDPRSVRGGKNGLLFRLMLPFGYRRYRKLGCKRMELKRVEVTGLDDFHALARTHWSSLFRRKDKTVVEIEFDNIYLLHIPEGGSPKVFAWITPDERRALKDHGIG